WRGEFPTDDVVTHAIGELRRAFGDDPRTAAYIRTIPRVGYALVAAVEQSPTAAVMTTAESETSDNPERPPGKPAAFRRTTRWAMLAVAVAFALIAALRFWPGDSRPVGGESPARYAGVEDRSVRQAAGDAGANAPREVPVSYLRGQEQLPNASPDGSLVAYSAQPDPAGPRRVYIQAMDGGTPRPVSTVDVDSEAAPVFSADGRRLVFQRVRGEQCRFVIASVLGGSEQEIGSCSPHVITHVDWAPDSRSLLVPMVSADSPPHLVLHLWHLADSRVEPLRYPTDADSNDVQARYSPDGSRIAFRRGVMPNSDLFVMDADGSNQKQLTRFGGAIPGFDWSSDGRWLLFPSDHDGGMRLWRVDTRSGELTPTAVRNVEWPDAARLRDVLVFTRGEASSEVVEMDVDGAADAAPRLLSQSSRGDSLPAYAPDGERIAFVSWRRGEAGMFVRDASGVRLLSLHGEAEMDKPVWSPDGRQLAYVVNNGTGRLFVADVAAARARDISPDGYSASRPVFSADGKALIFGAREPDSRHADLWRLDLASGAMTRLTDRGGMYPQRLPDGDLVFLESNAGEHWRRLGNDGDVADLGLEGVGFWNRDAWQVTDTGMVALISSEPFGLYRHRWDGGGWQLMEPLGYERLGDVQFSLSPDGRRLAVTNVREWTGDVFRIEGAL
ncbi:MAG: PD40 domain-containing protein, partial [Xanthomonadales bacterium]|nr:PD40 domain-containing protein [Xanthomonadales bacterium]